MVLPNPFDITPAGSEGTYRKLQPLQATHHRSSRASDPATSRTAADNGVSQSQLPAGAQMGSSQPVASQSLATSQPVVRSSKKPKSLQLNQTKLAFGKHSRSDEFDSEIAQAPPSKKPKAGGYKIEFLEPQIFSDVTRRKRPTEDDWIYKRPRAVQEDEHTNSAKLSDHPTKNQPLPDQNHFFNLGKATIPGFNPERLLTSLPQTLTRLGEDEPENEPTEDKELGDQSHTHLDYTAAPISNIYEIYDDIAKKAVDLGFKQALAALDSQKLRIVTMCSGTESPVLSMQLLQKALQKNGFSGFTFEHLASAEIEPFKQAYIERNFSPPIIFRDVTEFRDPKNKGSQIEKPYTVYGSQAEKPEDVHILVAGSSCVDYSNLNTSTKAFGKPGESKSTMMGIYDYARSCRPNIVILENVKNAPWEEIEQMWESIGYACEVVHVDTKNYYIPQTRQRGYMMAVDAQRAETANLDTASILRVWKDCMSKFQRRASSPYTDFIYSDHEIALEEAKRSLALVIQPAGKSQDWANCRQRYSNFRAKKKLGFSKPLSNWQNNGSCEFPDFTWQFWNVCQRERIWDTLDIDLLQYVHEREYDMTYKNRWIDLSQNVDRDTDSRHWGIVSCITPSGLPYDTRRGGPITGREALALQGIPVDELILNKETSKQLQDLAGNAMTTTVVGPAIFSAIVAAAGLDKDNKPASPAIFDDFSGKNHSHITAGLEASISPIFWPYNNESPEVTNLRNLVPQVGVEHALCKTELLKMANLSRQLCNCEGLAQNKAAKFFGCRECGHTACSQCLGNPQHDYVLFGPGVPKEARVSPSDFISKISKALPRILCLISSNASSMKVILDDCVGQEISETTKHFVETALNDQYYFSGVDRGQEWKVQYESPSGNLELRFVPSFIEGAPESDGLLEMLPMDCYWLLFAKAGPSLPVESSLRTGLIDAVARMDPSNSLLEGTWKLRTYKPTSSEVIITGESDEIKGWENKLGLQDSRFTSLMVHTDVKISLSCDDPLNSALKTTGVLGTYRLLGKCGGASGSLHRQISQATGTAPNFLFLDPEPLGDAIDDRYVISTRHERRSQSDHRQVVARLPKGWRPVKSQLGKAVNCELMTQWKEQPDLKFEVPDLKDTIGVSLPISFPGNMIQHESCRTDLRTFIIAKVPLHREQQRVWRAGKSYKIDMVQRPEILRDLEWILKPAGNVAIYEHWQDVSPLTSSDLICQDCNPTPPSLVWQWVRSRRGQSLAIKPFEDPEKAATFEQALKARPCVVSSAIHSHGPYATVEIRVNLSALIHRTLSILGSGSRTVSTPRTVHWRISTYNPLYLSPKFPGVKPESSAESAMWTPATCKMYPFVDQQGLGLPMNFKRPLWASQLTTLSWMQTREMASSWWSEREQLEVCIPSVGWRLEVKANQLKPIRGGILADDVGSGKTTTAIALIATDLPNVPFMPADNASQAPPPRIQSDATLILVPKNIIGQWKEEMHDCFLDMPEDLLLPIESVKKLRSLTVDQLSQAKVILAPWDLFSDVRYWTSMRQLCCAPNIPKKAGRAFQQWQNECLKDLGRLIEGSDQCGDLEKFKSLREKMLNDNPQKYQAFNSYRKRRDVDHIEEDSGKMEFRVPDLPIGDLDMQEAAPKPLESTLSLDAGWLKELEEWSKTGSHVYPLFHLFSFRRIIVDEFTYLGGQPLLAILTLTRRSSWMLSGTPPLTDFDSVNTMAKLLGTRISSTDHEKGCFGFGKDGGKMGNEKSYAEEFHDYTGALSANSRSSQYELAHKFGKEFIRKDKPNMKGTEQVHHVLLLAPSAVERATYWEFYIPLSTQSFKFYGKVAGKQQQVMNRQERINAAILGSSGAEHALIYCLSELRDLNGGGSLHFHDMRKAKEDDFQQICNDLLLQLKETFWYRENIDKEPGQDPPFPAFLRRALNEANIGDRTIARFMDVLAGCGYDDQTEPSHLLIDKMKLDVYNRKLAEWQERKNNHGKKVQAWKDLKQAGKTPKEPKAFDIPKPKPVDANTLYGLRNGDPKVHNKETTARATKMNTLLRRLVELAKSIRLFNAIENITSGQRLLACSHCNKIPATYEDVYVLGTCGHIVHTTCFTSNDRPSKEQDACPQGGCDATPTPQQLISADSLLSPKVVDFTKHGSKMSAVIKQIEQIRKMSEDDDDEDKDEYVLLFVQYEGMKNHVVEALEDSGIEYLDGSHNTKVAVEHFKASTKNKESKSKGRGKGKGKEKEGLPRNPRVLILMLDSPDSAGWNLQEANHVIFVAPLVAKSQYDYDSIMKQAVGRAYRFGQTKRFVHVYHFVMAETIEVNILEDRCGKAIVQREGEYKLLKLDALEKDEVRFRGASLGGVMRETQYDGEEGGGKEGVDETEKGS